MVSGINDGLRQLWIRPGQTERGRVNHRAREPPKLLLTLPLTNSRIVRKQQYHRENNELVELSVLRKTTGSLYVCGNLMPHAIQIRQTRGPEVLNWTPIETGEPWVESGARATGGGRAQPRTALS